jgi:hypothetical protein
MEPILVDANTAAKLLSISRSQFDAKVAQGVLPAAIRLLGRPLWCPQQLRLAVTAVPSPTADAKVPPVPAPLKEWQTEL